MVGLPAQLGQSIGRMSDDLRGKDSPDRSVPKLERSNCLPVDVRFAARPIPVQGYLAQVNSRNKVVRTLPPLTRFGDPFLGCLTPTSLAYPRACAAHVGVMVDREMIDKSWLCISPAVRVHYTDLFLQYHVERAFAQLLSVIGEYLLRGTTA